MLTGSQVVIATHSPILLAYPGADILLFGPRGLARVAYEDTEHYQIMGDFLNRYPRMLEELFAAGDDGETRGAD